MTLPERPKISLAMIVRDAEAHLPKTLDSIAPFVDEIVIVDTGSLDKTREIANAYTPNVHEFEWVKDFSAARNFSLGKCSNDIVLWLDDDDVVINGESLCDMARACFSMGATECWVDYDYTLDRHGNCKARQQRERFLHRKIYEWRGKIHETPCANFLASQEKILREHGYVKHSYLHEDAEEHYRKAQRNLEILEGLEKSGEMEHRMMFFYANTLKGIGKLPEAIAWYRRYVNVLERSSHRYSAMINMSLCLMGLNRLDEMRAVLTQAIMEQPALASGYMRLAQSFAISENWDRALDWAKEAEAHVGGGAAELMYDPTDLIVIPHQVKCGALISQGKFEEAKAELELPLKYYPDNEGLIYFQRTIDQDLARVQGSNSFIRLTEQLIAEGHEERLEGLANSAPDTIRFLPHVLRYRSRPARKPDQKSIGIFCPIFIEPWGPKSLETGIGGSETAVIQMSKELAKLGWDVTVYCHTKEHGTFDGVHWTHHVGWNQKKDFHDVMVTWRDPKAPIQYGQNCRVSVFWAHDVLSESQWFMEPSAIYDSVFVLSDYHRTLYKERIPDELLWTTANATDPELWVEPKNEPHKVIYASCPSRGLIHLLREWSYIKDEVPDAELDIYYGWNAAFRQQAAVHPGFRRLMTEIENLKGQNGVTWHGRVGKHELAEAFSRAQVWAYPCIFPEISCITAMEAQIHGCTPVVSTYAALQETVRFGLRDEYDFGESKDHVMRYVQTLIDELREPKFALKEEMVSWARKTFRWEAVAREWDLHLRSLLARSGYRLLTPGQIPEISSAMS